MHQKVKVTVALSLVKSEGYCACDLMKNIMLNGMILETTSADRVSFGSSKGSMVETLIYESPVLDQPGKSGKAGALPILANGTSSRNGSRGDAAHDSPDSIASG